LHWFAAVSQGRDLDNPSLKAKSPGSSPGNATKNQNKINSLKRNEGCRAFAFFGLVALW